MSERWTFLTHHAHVLISLSADPDMKIDQLATKLGVTSRYTVNIFNDLTEGGYLTREKHGRRNHYFINRSAELRHETSAHKTIGELIDSLGSVGGAR